MKTLLMVLFLGLSGILAAVLDTKKEIKHPAIHWFIGAVSGAIAYNILD